MPSTESNLRKYFHTFTGIQAGFSKEQEQLFSTLFHDKFTLSDKHIYTLSRDQAKEMHAHYSSKGTKITLIHYRNIGIHCRDVKFKVENKEEEKTMRVVCSIEGKRIFSARVVDSFTSIIRAHCSSDLRIFGFRQCTSVIYYRTKRTKHPKDNRFFVKDKVKHVDNEGSNPVDIILQKDEVKSVDIEGRDCPTETMYPDALNTRSEVTVDFDGELLQEEYPELKKTYAQAVMQCRSRRGTFYRYNWVGSSLAAAA